MSYASTFTGSNPAALKNVRLSHSSISRKSISCYSKDYKADDSNIVKGVSELLWGKGLPPGLLVSAVKEGWTAAWQVMMSQLAPSSKSGSYERPASMFRNRIEQGSRFPPSSGRYHLYAALSCPWAHRTLIVHTLKGLSNVVPLSIAAPSSSGLWEFLPWAEGKDQGKETLVPTVDKAHGCRYVRDIYRLRPGGYDGRCTLPMLWDSVSKEVVSNDSADIIEILNSSFNGFSDQSELDLEPAVLKSDIDKWNRVIYEKVNNGVYKCGFATSQDAYLDSVTQLFDCLDNIDNHLGTSRYLCGDIFTLADVRLFTTLLRFDAVYSTLFKCTSRKIAQYTNLGAYLRDVYQIPGVRSTCNIGAITENYFGTLFPLNPGGIVPVLPYSSTDEYLSQPHNRDAVTYSIANV